MELITREVQIRKVNTEERTFTGLAAPYDQPADIGGVYTEQFARGAFGTPVGVKLFDQHREIIGQITSGNDTDAGFEITAQISKTSRGNDIYAMLTDGTLDRLSVGFIPVEHTVDEENGTVTRTKVDLKEVSVVPFPAYDGATISEVRAESITTTNKTEEVSNETIMNEITYDDSELRGQIDVLTRELAVMNEKGTLTNSPAPQFRTGGEWLKAFVSRDEAAEKELRAYTGSTTTDLGSTLRNDWHNDLIVIINKGRPVLNTFTTEVLGSSGMNVEYPKYSATSGVLVAQQVNQGDVLSYAATQVTTATAPVKTYGGYAQLSRQEIDRSTVDYLSAVLRNQAAGYAKVTNDAVRTALTGSSAQAGTSFTLSTATAASYLNAFADAANKVYANGNLSLDLDFVLVSTDVWLQMATLVDTAGRPIFDVAGSPVNTAGNANIRGIAGQLAGLPVIVDPGLSAKTMYFGATEAITTYENAGAPLRLDWQDVTSLIHNFSLFGYMAVAVKDANTLVKPVIS